MTAAAVAAGAVAPVTAGNNGSLALVTPEAATSPVGLTISRRPAARPQDMARAIEEAVAAVARLPEPPVVEEIAPEAEPEPEPAADSILPQGLQDMLAPLAPAPRDPNLPHDLSPEQSPLLANPLARFDCEQHAAHDGGDHLIIVGRVLRATLRDGDPLLFVRGKMTGFGA